MADSDDKPVKEKSSTMSDLELLNVVDSEMKDADSYQANLGKDRIEAMRYYRLELYGDEIEGRSQVVTSEVQDTVEWAMPQMLRMFTGQDDAVKFIPMTADAIQAAADATAYINHIVWTENPGFLIFHDWLKDGLLQKVGCVKFYREERQSSSEETYEGLNEAELAMIVQQFEAGGKEVEIIAKEDGEQPGTLNVTVRLMCQEDHFVIEPVPPEEIRLTRATRRLKDARFFAHRRLMSRSELIEMGFDRQTVMALPVYERNPLTDLEARTRYRDEQFDGYNGSVVNEMAVQVEVIEAYVKVDFDGDGVAERRRVLRAGNTLLSNERHDTLPFAVWSPIMVPHKVIGTSLADSVIPIQRISSALWRNTLDNMYQTNNSRTVARVTADGGGVVLDDLLTNRPGGVIRTDGDPTADVAPLQVHSILGESISLLNEVDNMRERRTGVQRMTQSQSMDAVHDTATGLNKIMAAGNERLMMMARVFAETGVRDLYWGLLELVCKYQDTAREIMVNGHPMVIDPRAWKNRLSVCVNVGLGTADTDAKLAQLSAVLDKQTQGMQVGLSNPALIYNTLKDMLALIGQKDPSRYFVDPNSPQGQMAAQQMQQSQQQPSDPLVQAESLKQQAESQRHQYDLQLQQAKAQQDMEMAKYKADHDAMLEKYKADQAHLERMTELNLKYAEQIPAARSEPLPGSVANQAPALPAGTMIPPAPQ